MPKALVTVSECSVQLFTFVTSPRLPQCIDCSLAGIVTSLYGILFLFTPHLEMFPSPQLLLVTIPPTKIGAFTASENPDCVTSRKLNCLSCIEQKSQQPRHEQKVTKVCQYNLNFSISWINQQARSSRKSIYYFLLSFQTGFSSLFSTSFFFITLILICQSCMEITQENKNQLNSEEPPSDARSWQMTNQ